MIVGVPKEIKDGERRVALTPAGVRALCERGHRVLVQMGAGRGIRVPDADYRQAGASMVSQAASLYARSEMVLKVKEPLPPEYGLLRPEQLLFTFLHLTASEQLTLALLKSGVVALGYETVQTDGGALPLLVPMSEIAGRMSVQIGAHLLEAQQGGRGTLLSGVPGVPPGEVVILGCGVVGSNAARVAAGMGGHVTALDVNHDRLRSLEDSLGRSVTTIYASSQSIAQTTSYADLLVGAVMASAGTRAPKLVTRGMVRKMRPGSVIVDVSVDQGACIATIHPTTHSEPTYRVGEVVHYGVTNIPAAVPRTATHALTNVTLPWVLEVADKGIAEAVSTNTALARALNVARGQVAHPAVAAAFRLRLNSWQQILATEP